MYKIVISILKKHKTYSCSMKKKLNFKKTGTIILRLLIGVLIVVMVVVVPTIYINSRSLITDKFSGNRSEYQGVLEIWHIDTFEGGRLGKYGFLKARAVDFEATNKGLYFMVKNMTETECMLALQQGQRPAMFSFGIGVGSQLLDYLAKLNNSNTNLKPEFLQGGIVNEELFASAWCRGVYSLITTTKKLEEAKQSIGDSLVSIATNCGYTKTLKNKKTKTTYSLAFGSAGYVCPQLAYSHSYKNLVQNQTSIDANNISKTPYTAYCDFIEGKATILLGTQRDVARIENRLSVGKIDGVVYQHLTQYTDLVQYLGIVKTNDNKIYNACSKFIAYMCSNAVQKKLANIGMFTINNGLNIYTSGEWKNIEDLTIEPCVVPNVFTDRATLQANKQACIDCEQI